MLLGRRFQYIILNYFKSNKELNAAPNATKIASYRDRDFSIIS